MSKPWTCGTPAGTPRTRASFAERLSALTPGARIALDGSMVLGLCILKGPELDQLYVAPKAQSTGTAAALMADACARLKAAGHTKAHLACALGNTRAARFYEKSGWTNRGTERDAFDTAQGPFEMEIWRFEKAL